MRLVNGSGRTGVVQIHSARGPPASFHAKTTYLGVPPPPRRGDTGGVGFADDVDVIESRGPAIPASPRGADILAPVLLTIVYERVK